MDGGGAAFEPLLRATAWEFDPPGLREQYKGKVSEVGEQADC